MEYVPWAQPKPNHPTMPGEFAEAPPPSVSEQKVGVQIRSMPEYLEMSQVHQRLVLCLMIGKDAWA